MLGILPNQAVRFYFVALLMLVLISLKVRAVAAQEDIFLNIYTEQMPPYQFINSKQQLVGINVELLKWLLDEEGIAYRLKLAPWTRAYNGALNNPSGGVISTAMSPSRLDKFKWVGPFPSSGGGIYLYRLAVNKHIIINTFEDIKQYVLGYVRHGIYEEVFRSKGLTDQHLLGFVSSNESYKMLFNGKIDLVLGSEGTINKLLAIHGFPKEHVVKAFRVMDFGGNYLALNRQLPDAIVKRLNLRLSKLRENPKARAVINKYSSGGKVIWLSTQELMPQELIPQKLAPKDKRERIDE